MVEFTASPFASPLYLLAKPAGSRCNLACKYCYYLEKSLLFEKHSPQVMDDALLEKFIHDYIGAQTTQEVLFTWHGGEPLMRPLQFYKKAVALQRKYAAGRRIDNCLQTNGTLLTDEWCRFFKEQGWLVGVSVDGTQEMHDAYRRAKGGGPSHHKVMQGIRLLQKHGVEWNALAVVNDFNADQPKEFYRFFKEIGCRFIQFTPIVERLLPHADGRQLAAVEEEGTGGMMPFSVSPEQWGDFLIGIFDEWVKEDVGEYFVQLFDATLANWMGVQPGICTLARTCGHAGAIEWNGDVFACDHFVFPQYRLGNLREKSLVEMMYSPKQREFGRAKQTALPRQCRECRWLFACNGECPKNRFARTADGEKGLNFLCNGYRRFFEHVAPYMDWMKRELMANRPPAGIVDLLRNNPKAFD
ncbi:MAG: anaerobic sulfatase-maturation protein [Bacteroidales bacterium]|nr:anaerobic sulfatase-maturation protein [Bacteroidales bacterium]MDD6731987.1 anaerobic sulfatase-maturation protein [Bacteroidales bacterium]MDY4557576.1 anaerobic sulfatase-maturation protein [Alloprevotella sp.]